jgi:DNA-binding MarR family transcriptional regulator
MSITPAGRRLMTDRRSRSSLAVAQALTDGFTADERRRLVDAIPLLERLADRL